MNNRVLQVSIFLPDANVVYDDIYFTNDKDLNTFLSLYKDYVLNYVNLNSFEHTPAERDLYPSETSVLQYILENPYIKGNKLIADKVIGRIQIKEKIKTPEVKIPGKPYTPAQETIKIKNTEWKQLYFYRNIFTKKVRHSFIYTPDYFDNPNMKLIPATYSKEIYFITDISNSNVFINNPTDAIKYIENNHQNWGSQWYI